MILCYRALDDVLRKLAFFFFLIEILELSLSKLDFFFFYSEQNCLFDQKMIGGVAKEMIGTNMFIVFKLINNLSE